MVNKKTQKVFEVVFTVLSIVYVSMLVYTLFTNYHTGYAMSLLWFVFWVIQRHVTGLVDNSYGNLKTEYNELLKESFFDLLEARNEITQLRKDKEDMSKIIDSMTIDSMKKKVEVKKVVKKKKSVK